MLEKILKILKIHFQTNLTLLDGTPLKIDGEFDTGVNIYVVTEDGEIPLPEGEYKLSDESIILVKDGLIYDIIQPSTPETEENNESLDAPPETSSDELATQKGNPEVSGEPVVKEDEMPTTTGTTETTEPEVKAEDMPVEDIPVEEPEPEIDEKDIIIKELVDKVAVLDQAIADIMSKLNMISEKFSAAQPIVKKKEDNTTTMDPKLQSKVDLIKRLKSGNKNFLD